MQSNRLVLALVLLSACRASENTAEPRPAPPMVSSAQPSAIPVVASSSALPVTMDAGDPGPGKLVADEEVGPLIAKLSENPGDFPSENYVSNELSLPDVARQLRDPKLAGRAYVGVGPEQNYTYLAMLAPRVAYIVDIRRGNLLEHMFFRGCFEAGTTRAAFLSALLSRHPQMFDRGAAATFAELDGAFRAAPLDKTARDEGIARTKALMDRLHATRSKADDAAIGRIQSAFALHGLTIAYTMIGTSREYPSLGETLLTKDPDGAVASFLATEEAYLRVRRLVTENRVFPVVGDFGATHALRAVGEDMRARGIPLGVFYTSNVEQYLFDQKHYGNFIESVTSMPRDDESRIVRVWFDQGKPHPSQHPKHRTTQITITTNAFLARAASKPFKSYWEVVTQSESQAP